MCQIKMEMDLQHQQRFANVTSSIYFVEFTSQHCYVRVFASQSEANITLLYPRNCLALKHLL